jgi:hypothetical protein
MKFSLIETIAICSAIFSSLLLADSQSDLVQVSLNRSLLSQVRLPNGMKVPAAPEPCSLLIYFGSHSSGIPRKGEKAIIEDLKENGVKKVFRLNAGKEGEYFLCVPDVVPTKKIFLKSHFESIASKPEPKGYIKVLENKKTFDLFR